MELLAMDREQHQGCGFHKLPNTQPGVGFLGIQLTLSIMLQEVTLTHAPLSICSKLLDPW